MLQAHALVGGAFSNFTNPATARRNDTRHTRGALHKENTVVLATEDHHLSGLGLCTFSFLLQT